MPACRFLQNIHIYWKSLVLNSHNLRWQTLLIGMSLCYAFPMSFVAPSIAFMWQSLALPSLVLAGCLAEDSAASGIAGQHRALLKASLQWWTAADPAALVTGCQAGCLSSATRRDRRGGVCARGCVSRGWRLHVGGDTDWDVIATWIVYVWRRERPGKSREGSQSPAAERESRCSRMSPRPMNLQQETQYKLGFVSTACIDLF